MSSIVSEKKKLCGKLCCIFQMKVFNQVSFYYTLWWYRLLSGFIRKLKKIYSYILVRIMLKNDDFLKPYNAKYDSLHLEGLPGNCYFYCHLHKH